MHKKVKDMNRRQQKAVMAKYGSKNKPYVIVNDKNQPLSSFYPNDMVTRHQLKFRNSDIYTYPTKKEAENHLNYIKKECKQEKESNRLKIKSLNKIEKPKIDWSKSDRHFENRLGI